jgi:hypothetical protein
MNNFLICSINFFFFFKDSKDPVAGRGVVGLAADHALQLM